MDTVWKQVVYACLILLLLLTVGQTTIRMKEDCQTCQDIVTAFKQGMKKTAKSNFGGGNTDWEEKSLGSFATSETRLVEVMETVCETARKESRCHYLVEENEGHIEEYWNRLKRNEEVDLHEWLCLEKIAVCCPNGTYGSECSACPGGKDTPCNNHGDCDGVATRGGTGRCLCHAEYAGEVCSDCREGYYEKFRNSTHLECASCHISCKTCSGGEPKDCDECRVGYEESEEEGCKDVDECARDKGLCKANQYCSNTVGSFVCMNCDQACESCLGTGPDKCLKCKGGFRMNGTVCIDIDECNEDQPCTGEHQVCVNTAGSFRCDCTKNYEMMGDTCVHSSDETEDQDDDDTDEGDEMEEWDEEEEEEDTEAGTPDEDDDQGTSPDDESEMVMPTLPPVKEYIPDDYPRAKKDEL